MCFYRFRTNRMQSQSYKSKLLLATEFGWNSSQIERPPCAEHILWTDRKRARRNVILSSLCWHKTDGLGDTRYESATSYSYPFGWIETDGVDIYYMYYWISGAAIIIWGANDSMIIELPAIWRRYGRRNWKSELLPSYYTRSSVCILVAPRYIECSCSFVVVVVVVNITITSRNIRGTKWTDKLREIVELKHSIWLIGGTWWVPPLCKRKADIWGDKSMEILCWKKHILTMKPKIGTRCNFYS